MSQYDSELSLHQMLDHAREAIILSKGKSPSELIDDRVLALASVRHIVSISRFSQGALYLLQKFGHIVLYGMPDQVRLTPKYSWISLSLIPEIAFQWISG